MVRRMTAMAAGAAGLVTLAGTVVAGMVVAGAGPAQATPAAAAWSIVKQVHSGAAGDFTAVVATGTSTGWAFNGNTLAAPTTKPTAWQLNGTTWTRDASFPGRRGEEVVAAGAASPSNVWAFTDVGVGSRVLRWNGHTWSVVRTFGQPIGGASVVSRKDVWVFGQSEINQQLGVWHYNGRRWSKLSSSLDGGSALSATSAWAFSGTSVYHFTGHSWAKTSIRRLLPAKLPHDLNDPILTAIYAQSATSVYAIGNGQAEDEGGPIAVLHYNGSKWRRVAEGYFGDGTQPSQQISPDGSGGLWLPMPGFGGEPSYVVHYSGGTLTEPALPHGSQGIDVESIANVPGTTEMLGGGFTHKNDNPGLRIVAVILQYGS
jgi:hypothetical protein